MTGIVEVARLLALRTTTPATVSEAAGEGTPLRVDDSGQLWVRLAGDTTVTSILSGSTKGAPIQITATGTPGTTIHAASATGTTKLWVYLTNTSDNPVTVTIELGGSGLGNEVDVIVPAHDVILALGGAAVDNSVATAAYADTASVVNAFGYVENLT